MLLVTLEDIMKGRVGANQPSWFRLYLRDDQKMSEAVLEKAGRSGLRLLCCLMRLLLGRGGG